MFLKGTAMYKFLILVTIVLFPNLSFAQENSKPQFNLPTLIQCGQSSAVWDILQNKYQEKPFALGIGSLIRNDGLPVSGDLVMWTNPDKKSFTVSVTFPEVGVTCMIVNGREFQLLEGYETKSGLRL